MTNVIDHMSPPWGKVEVKGGFLREEKEESGDEGGDDGVLIRRYNIFKLKELDGHVEDVLANEQVPIVERLLDAIGRSITEMSDEDGHVVNDPRILRTAPDNLLLGDNTQLMLALRQISIGDIYDFKVRCPIASCKVSQSKKIDLREFEPKPVLGDLFTRKRVFTSRDGHEIVWEMATGKVNKEFSQGHKALSKKEKATRVLQMRVKTIDGKEPTIKDLKDLPMIDRVRLRHEFDEQEGGIDTAVDVTCTNCGVEFEVDMDILGEHFFTPSDRVGKRH